ncbi:MAG TPA: peptidoglycan-binding protein, partial [Flavobacterium sp.]|nr:peptidoglycan-binding protein [Flavobacterium sp.]
MLNKFLLLVLLSPMLHAQPDTSVVATDSVPTQLVVAAENKISNAAAMKEFYKELADLQLNRNRKINIVHVGDSHIQADLMTAKTRRNLQQVFGNGGRGFVFPYSLAKTNGARDIRFSSTEKWESLRNIYPPDGSKVGLSGISLQPRNTDFVIGLDAKDSASFFNRIKIITPDNANSF